MSSRPYYEWDKADKWLEENPNSGYPAFTKAFPDYPFTYSTFSRRKRKALGQSRNYSSTIRLHKTLYESLETIPMEELQKLDAFSLIKKIINLTNKHGNTRMSLVRLSEPDSVEVRRFTR
jgi:hypothetical protein